MKKIVSIILLLTTSILQLQAQRANVLATYQLIENGKYSDAKKAIEDAIEDEKSAKWFKTWHARGLLCQTAYEKGIKDKDKKKYELYPDQLYVAYESYEKCMSLNESDRIKEQIKPQYILLVNNFLSLGQENYKNKKYDAALKAFEHALMINKSEFLNVELDTNLVYNTALAAYKHKDLEKAISHLTQLCEMNYSPNVSHLLFNIQLEKGDTIAAETSLITGIERFNYDETLVLLIVDMYYTTKQIKKAIAVLDSAIVHNPEKYTFYYNKGLIYQKNEEYHNAIEAYFHATKVDPEKVESYTNIGTCYYNIGVEIEENARSITNNKIFLEEKKNAVAARKSAVDWLEKAYEKNPENQAVKKQLIQLYRTLQLNDKINALL